jgi:hypothetical protein
MGPKYIHMEQGKCLQTSSISAFKETQWKYDVYPEGCDYNKWGTEKSKLVIIDSQEQQIFLLYVHNKILIWLKMRWYNEMVGMLQFLQN